MMTIVISLIIGALIGACAVSITSIGKVMKRDEPYRDIQAELRMAKTLQNYKEMVLLKHAQVHEARVVNTEKCSAVYCGDQCVARYYDEDNEFNIREAHELADTINHANA